MISGSSVLCALVLYTIVLAVVCILRRRTRFVEKGGGPVLLLAAALATIRLLLPIEIPFTRAIRSWNVLGTALIFFRTYSTLTWALLTAWGVGAVVCILRDVWELCRAHKRCDSYTPVENPAVQKVAERCSIPCPVQVSSNVRIPYVSGIFRHTIYLPALEFSDEEIELILAHETQHIRSHDALIKLLFGVLSAAMWWNPAARWSRREIDALLELRCDAKVTKRMKKGKQIAYAEMLLKFAVLAMGGEKVPALALDESSAVGQPSAFQQRVRVLGGPQKRIPRSVLGAAGCAMLAVFFASYLVVVQPAGVPSKDDFVEESEVYYLEDYDGPVIDEGVYSTFIVKGPDGRYQLFIDYEFSRYLSDEEVASDQYQNFDIFEENRQR